VTATRPSLPTLFVTEDPTLEGEAFAAGATDVFVRHDGVDAVPILAQRLENILAHHFVQERGANDETVALLHSMYDVTTDR